MNNPGSPAAASRDSLDGLKDSYDIIVIGGGIQGATLAWEAASRALSVLLVEQCDFGSGASANSLKIIHGGVRYLQRLDFTRMRQSIREQRTLLQMAPHLVRPMRCIIPTYNKPGKGRYALWAGMRAYDLIAFDRNRGIDASSATGKSGLLTLSEFHEELPIIADKNITGGAVWWDAQVHNSERLVLAFAMSAKSAGADIRNHVQVTDIVVERGRVRGIMIRDMMSGNGREIRCDLITDCSGSWRVSDSAYSNARDEHCYARAINLVIRRRLAASAFGISGGGDQNRLLFVVPWRDGSLAGTWYEAAERHAYLPEVTGEDISRALQVINGALDGVELLPEDVSAVHAGLLPCQPMKGRPAEPVLSDRYSITDGAEHGAAGLICIQGVKYTTARDVSIKALACAGRFLKTKVNRLSRHARPLYGAGFSSYGRFKEQCLRRYSPRYPAHVVGRLVDNYGIHIHGILARSESDPDRGQSVPGSDIVLQAEIDFVLEHEMVLTLSDLIFRRTGLGSFVMPAADSIAFCADAMAMRMGWDSTQKNNNIIDLFTQHPRWIEDGRPVGNNDFAKIYGE